MRHEPPLDVSGFILELNKQDVLYGLCNAIRNMTPPRSVLLVDNSEIYYPELTSRSLYVAADNSSFAGINLHEDDLDANVRGYGQQILTDRRAILTEFFDGKDSSLREMALRSVQSLNRPIAVIVGPAHPDLLNWLRAEKDASELYAQNDLSLWLIDEAGSRR
jgi:hypothetical protein